MERASYIKRGLLSLLILLPLAFTGYGFATVVLADILKVGNSLALTAHLPFLGFCAWRGARFARRHQADFGNERALVRYRPVIIAIAWTLTVALIAALLPDAEGGSVFSIFNTIFGWSHLPTSFPVALAFLFSSAPPWLYLAVPLSIDAAFGLGMAYGYRQLEARRHDWAAGAGIALLFLSMSGVIAWRLIALRASVFPAEDSTSPLSHYGERPELRDFRPLQPGNRLVKIGDPGLQIASNHPRFDGSTALFPVYAAAAQAIYTGVSAEHLSTLVDSTKTPRAYQKLISGTVDLIMATPPSPEQRAKAEAAGVTLQLTPIAREAFVFFVHKENTITALTSEQIRAIYRKELIDWRDVGGAPRPILPFQRPAGSGSQTIFLSKVMAGIAPAKPLQAERMTGMGGVIREVASYRNSTRAIGYSFRYYLTTMDGNPDVKMLTIDGIEPTRENIRNGTYPYTSDIYLVTATGGKNPPNPHVAALIEWFQSPKGQALIEEVGYVGVK